MQEASDPSGIRQPLAFAFRGPAFREAFRKRGAALDNFIYTAPESADLPTERPAARPSRSSQTAAPASPSGSNVKWKVVGDIALTVGIGIAGFLLLSRSDNLSPTGATGAGAN